MTSLRDLQLGGTAGGTSHHDADITDVAAKVRMVKDADVFAYVDRCPPVASSGWFYALGRDVTLFEPNIHKARLIGA